MIGKPKVLIVDDQNISRGFFEMNVKASVNYTLADSISAADLAVKFCDYHEVDLILMDVMMRYGMDGITAAAEIKRRHPSIKIILTTSMAESDWEQRARDAGVESFWYKEYSDEPLLSVMDRTMAGEQVYPSSAPRVMLGNVARSDLTERELDVLRELTRGSTNEEISKELDITIHTVKRHIKNLMDKTGLETRLALAIHAKSSGMVVSEAERTKNKEGNI